MDFHDPLVKRMASFLREIGLAIEPGAVPGPSFLPGIAVRHGALVIDEEHLSYPGDVLHEAGHLAVVPPLRRVALHENVGNDGAEEMMAIAWSYAAALHLGIEPEIVFHEAGYRGGASSLRENFQEGRYLALPMLQWVGMAFDPKRSQQENVAPYPHMIRWLREA
ncbi:MAG: hypothetical protein P4L57_11005 [Rhizomicrobium sp.]|nr:hypothetical protein [Rhizomicrobium sp.]